jgi:hypothetical protein
MKPERKARGPQTDLSEKGEIDYYPKNGVDIVPINDKMWVVTTAS